VRASSTTPLDQIKRIVGIADRGIGADLDAGQRDVGGVQAVLGRIALSADALALAGTRNTPTPLLSRLALKCAR